MSNSVFTTINPQTNKEITMRLERPEERFAVESLVREAFWNVYRPGCLEHYMLHQLRDDAAFVPELNLVLELEGQLMGQIMYMRSAITLADGSELPVMTFGPIGIAPEFKRQGYGLMLLEYSMKLAKEMGVGALATEGNIDFYGKAGFVVGKSVGIRYAADPEADYFIVKELQEGFLAGRKGTYADPAGYFVDEAETEAFDKQFPPKEKLKLPGQLW
ncbi:MAG: GNAT family N-acetyltransferase [Phascolarctobacterium sp.]